MAVDDDGTDEKAGASESASADQTGDARGHRPWRPSGRVLATAAALIVIAALASATAVMAIDHRATSREESDCAAFLQAARQAVVNLTTISADDADADIARILDGSTGPFHDDFTSRSASFTSVVKQAHVSTTGSVTEAGIESFSGDEAQVLVSATSKVTNTAGAQDEPRTWRLRLAMHRTQGRILVSNVDFVA